MELFSAKSGGLVDAAYGVVPTVDTWDSNPTSLSNATDHNESTSTGEGSRTTTSATTIGHFNFDLGTAKLRICGYVFGGKATNGGVYVSIDESDDGNTWVSTAVTSGATRTTATEVILPSVMCLTTKRYVRLRFANSSSTNPTTGYGKLYSFYAYNI